MFQSNGAKTNRLHEMILWCENRTATVNSVINHIAVYVQFVKHWTKIHKIHKTCVSQLGSAVQLEMTPAEEQRRQLDALMGISRNESSSKSQHFTDPQICRNFCCGLCPHDLFTNTVCFSCFGVRFNLQKMDLGPCPKLHSAVWESWLRVSCSHF